MDEEVSVVGSTWSKLFLVPSPDKEAVAALVSGESGSGKTVLAAALLQKKLQYLPRWRSPTNEPVRYVRLVLRDSFKNYRELDESNFMTDDEKTVRNRMACEAVEDLFRVQALDSKQLDGIVKNLVLIIDEVGMCLNLVRGCISAAAAREARDVRSPLLPFAEEVFFVFCGTSVEFAGFDDDSHIDIKGGAGRQTTTLTKITSNSQRVIFIRMRSACKEFYINAARTNSDKENIKTVYAASNIVTALMSNSRAGCTVVMSLRSYGGIVPLHVLKAMSADLLTTVGGTYAQSNGIGWLMNQTSPEVVQRFWRTALSTVMGVAMPDECIPAVDVVRVGMMSWSNDAFTMSTALVALCLCQFGQSVTPAVDWTSFEQLSFSCVFLQHIVEAVDGPQTVNSLQLRVPYPSESNGVVQIPCDLRAALETLPCGHTLVVLNGDKAPFANVFSVHHCHDVVVVKLVQCKYFTSNAVLLPADYATELLKWSLRPKLLGTKPSDAKRAAERFPDNVTSSLRCHSAIVSRAALQSIAILVGGGRKPLLASNLFFSSTVGASRFIKSATT